MPLHSMSFLIFFILVGGVYYALPHRFRWIWLLAASAYFFMGKRPGSLVLLIVTTGASYYLAIRMAETAAEGRRRALLVLSLAINLGLLFVVKYFSFFSQSLFLFKPHALQFLLPLGISFYTFKNVSYSIDVYRKALSPEKHPGFFALYVVFYPQLLAGPIERAARLLPQFHKSVGFDDRKIVRGLRLILWGLFQKMVVADNLTPFVNLVYSDPAHASGSGLLIGTFLFAIQIYYDFAGYSDIAIGTAQVLGYETMRNFDRPYSSRSIAEFWRRWHISLSSWLRDYLYIPLGGNRVSVPRGYANLMIVFVLCGLWHGANWTFLIWGGLHGFYLVFSHVTAEFRRRAVDQIGLNKMPRLLGGLRQVTTFFLVSFAWVFFRAGTLSDAVFIVTRLFMGMGDMLRFDFLDPLLASGPAGMEAIMGLVALALAEGFRSLFAGKEVQDGLSQLSTPWRWSAYYILLVGILLFGHLDSEPFIYFQF